MTYQIGNKFMRGWRLEYVLAQLSDKEQGKCLCGLINITEGTLWSTPVTVVNYWEITTDEFVEITAGRMESFRKL